MLEAFGSRGLDPLGSILLLAGSYTCITGLGSASHHDSLNATAKCIHSCQQPEGQSTIIQAILSRLSRTLLPPPSRNISLPAYRLPAEDCVLVSWRMPPAASAQRDLCAKDVCRVKDGYETRYRCGYLRAQACEQKHGL